MNFIILSSGDDFQNPKTDRERKGQQISVSSDRKIIQITQY